jgi:hypothetical protein
MPHHPPLHATILLVAVSLQAMTPDRSDLASFNLLNMLSALEHEEAASADWQDPTHEVSGLGVLRTSWSPRRGNESTLPRSLGLIEIARAMTVRCLSGADAGNGPSSPTSDLIHSFCCLLC